MRKLEWKGLCVRIERDEKSEMENFFKKMIEND